MKMLDFEKIPLPAPENLSELLKTEENFSHEDEMFFQKLKEEFFSSQGFEDRGKYQVLKNFFYPYERVYFPIKKLCGERHLDEKTVFEYFFLLLSEDCFLHYQRHFISERIFKETFSEMLLEINHAENFNYMWFAHHLRRNIFKIGSVCFQIAKPKEFLGVEINKKIVKKDDCIIKIHIPENSLIDTKSRVESYKEAESFFGLKNTFFVCDSWLLYPENKKLLDQSSNIRSFSEDFMLISSENFSHKEALGHIKSEDTSLAKAYRKYAEEGGKLGSAVGIMLFENGEIYKE